MNIGATQERSVERSAPLGGHTSSPLGETTVPARRGGVAAKLPPFYPHHWRLFMLLAVGVALYLTAIYAPVLWQAARAAHAEADRLSATLLDERALAARRARVAELRQMDTTGAVYPCTADASRSAASGRSRSARPRAAGDGGERGGACRGAARRARWCSASRYSRSRCGCRATFSRSSALRRRSKTERRSSRQKAHPGIAAGGERTKRGPDAHRASPGGGTARGRRSGSTDDFAYP